MGQQKTFLLIFVPAVQTVVDLLTSGCVAQVLQFCRQGDVADGIRWNRFSGTTLCDGVVLKPLQGKNQRRMPRGTRMVEAVTAMARNEGVVKARKNNELCRYVNMNETRYTELVFVPQSASLLLCAVCVLGTVLI